MIENPVDPVTLEAYNPSDEATPMLHLYHTPPAVSFPPAPFPAIRPRKVVQEEMKKPAQFKVGIVTVTEGRTSKRGSAFFTLRYIDPDSGRRVRRRVSGLELEEIKDMAENLTRRAYTHRGYLAEKAPETEEGLLEALRLAHTRPHVLRERIRQSKVFLLWLTERYPAVKTWEQLRPVMIQIYQRELEQKGLKLDSIRLRLEPLKAAWKHIAENWPDLVRPLPKLKMMAPPRREEIQCLEADELVILLGWLKEHAPALWPMACLQGLAGLRMLEAAALRRQDVDLKAGTVTVTKTERHTPKTRDSYRTIPVCAEVLESLKETMDGQKVRPVTGELFVNERGNLWAKDALTSAWHRALKHAAAEPKTIKREVTGWPLTLNPHGLNLPRLGLIPARKLRAAFATLAGRMGAPDRLLKAYLGHSSGDILGGHYRRIELAELRTVSGLMNGWRELEKPGDVRQKSGNIPPIEVVSC